MEYRNKFYVVVRSRTSAGWNWAVDLDARTVRGGKAASKEAAIKAAERMNRRGAGANGSKNSTLRSGLNGK